jgi:hypothetical protein
MIKWEAYGVSSNDLMDSIPRRLSGGTEEDCDRFKQKAKLKN